MSRFTAATFTPRLLEGSDSTDEEQQRPFPGARRIPGTETGQRLAPITLEGEVRWPLQEARPATPLQEGTVQAFPHHYGVTVAGVADGDVELTAERLTILRSASPAEFDGPGDRWSPEMLLVGAVGDCLVLTFRAVAHASKLPWTSLRCQVTGTLDRIDRITQFTGFEVHATLGVPAGTDPERARRALEKAEQNCLIANSLKAPIHLVPEIAVAVDAVEASLSA